jgi:hypothetical protein
LAHSFGQARSSEVVEKGQANRSCTSSDWPLLRRKGRAFKAPWSTARGRAGVGISDGIQGLSCLPDRLWLAGFCSIFGCQAPAACLVAPGPGLDRRAFGAGDGGPPLVAADGGLSLPSGQRGGAALDPAAFDANPPAKTAPMRQVRLLAPDAVAEAGARMLQLLADAPADLRTAATEHHARLPSASAMRAQEVHR